MSVQFDDGEPLWVGRGGVRGPAVHARVDTSTLDDEQADELRAWLGHDLPSTVIVLVDQVDEDMPEWLCKRT